MLNKKCPVNDTSCQWNVLSMKFPVNKNVLSIKFPVNEMTYLWNVYLCLSHITFSLYYLNSPLNSWCLASNSLIFYTLIFSNFNLANYIVWNTLLDLFKVFDSLINYKNKLYHWTTLLLNYHTAVILYYFTTLLPFLLYYFTTLLPYCCTSVLLYYFTTLIPYCCTSVLLYYCTTVLLYYCTTLLPYCCTSVLL